MSFPVPARPALPPERVASAQFALRYEDVAQDGRMTAIAFPPALGWTVWAKLLDGHPAERALAAKGIVPILSRLIIAGTDATIRVDEPATATGGYQVARQEIDGEVAKLFLNMWVEVRGAAGRMVPPTGPGQPVVAGTVFAEHTFTRLFAPPDQRRVTRLDGPGLPEVPPTLYDAPASTTAMELPADATAVDAEFHPDPVVTAFGLDHTDSNQHVNSLVYPRLFAEAALRRMAAREQPRRVLVRELDIAYRKPSFAGDRVRIHVRLFQQGARLGACGFVADVDDPAARPRCCARMLFG
ncbi:MAG: hypothetical protein R3B06_24170 [Kofleriaceae bacterium]